ncbi:MAG: class I SAM-dependent methyltransferase [Planctomycetes bacterium]|nr:class I SAM-dependent methyltransferase [Planctomycetota bacterium]
MDRVAYETFRELEHSHFWFVSRRRIFFDQLDRLLPASPTMSATTGQNGEPPTARRQVLEIGCGAGGMLGPLQRYGEVAGLDIDHEFVGVCRERGFPNVLCGSGYELPFRDEVFDLVCLFDTLEHIPDEAQALREVLRVLRPGGALFVSVPCYQWLWSQNDKTAHHCRRYTATRLRRVLAGAGLRPVRVSYFNTFLLPLIVPSVLWQKLMDRLGRLPQGYNNMSVELSPWLNRAFTGVMSSERLPLRWLRFPLGHSAFALARREPE